MLWDRPQEATFAYLLCNVGFHQVSMDVDRWKIAKTWLKRQLCPVCPDVEALPDARPYVAGK